MSEDHDVRQAAEDASADQQAAEDAQEDQQAAEDEQATDPSTADAQATAAPSDRDLEALVAEHPEEVARLLERLDVVNELLDVGDVAVSAMDDEMVESLAGTGSNLAMAADGMATDDAVHLGTAVGTNASELAEGVETIATLQRTGTLDDLVEFAELASLLRAAFDDEMVESLAATGSRLGEVADTAADDDVADGIESLLAALGDATAEDPEPVGAIGLVKASRDPDVKAGLGVLLALAKALGRQTTDDGPAGRDRP